MTDYKEKIEYAISDTGREGYENVIQWLRDVHFYDTPASVRWHNNFRGGLAKHAWEVYQEALKDHSCEYVPLQSISLCALLHDVCKFDKYKLEFDGSSKSTGVCENGKHGQYSVEILENLGLWLSDEEKLAIKWHMGIHDPAYSKNVAEYNRVSNIPLCKLIREADSRASRSWYAEQWLKDFAEAKLACNTQYVRKQVFSSTLTCIRNKMYLSHTGQSVQLHLNPNALSDNAFCEVEVRIKRPVQQYDTKVSVVKQDCLACAHDMLCSDPTDDLCVLNMASHRNPGGGVYRGAGAQEEYLFRCTDYYRFLYQYASNFDSFKEYKIPRNQHHQYPLREFGGIYSHGVTVFRDTEANGYRLLDKPWRVNFVAVAAYHLPKGTSVIPQDKVDGTIRKIRAILRIAYNNGQHRLVLGAFGCGAFHNPPNQIARLFKQVLSESEFNGLFRNICFAIIEDHNSGNQNYSAFSSEFSNLCRE